MSETMNPDSDENLARYRAEARAFLTREAPAFSGAARKGLTQLEDLALGRRWQALKAAHGYGAVSVPKAYGGGGGTALQKVIFHQEELAYELPTHYFAISLSNPIPIMSHFATEAQKLALIPQAVRGEHIWCQLFSEPSAGSDLAALRLSAVRDGDGWRMNGQKVWTSWAQYADWGVVIARTDPTVPKHAGLTYFFLDMKTSGITVRPFNLLDGGNHINEVFFEDVYVPDAQRLGGVGEGFKVAISTLMIERLSVTDPWAGGPDLETVLELMRERTVGGRPAIEDPAFSGALVDAVIQERALNNIAHRAFAAIGAGRAPGPEGSITKLLVAAGRQKLCRLAMDVLGPEGLILEDDASNRHDFTKSWLSAPLSRIAGGTDQILRNTIAERVLGLPQDHRPDKGVPFNQLK